MTLGMSLLFFFYFYLKCRTVAQHIFGKYSHIVLWSIAECPENDIKVQTGQRRSCCIIIEQKSNKLSIQSRLSCHRRQASSIWKHRGTWAKTEKPKNNEQHSDITNICFVSLILRTVHLAQWLIACSSIVVINYFMLIHLVYIAIVFGQWLFVSFHPSPRYKHKIHVFCCTRLIDIDKTIDFVSSQWYWYTMPHCTHHARPRLYAWTKKCPDIILCQSSNIETPSTEIQKKKKMKKKWTEIDSYLVDGPI